MFHTDWDIVLNEEINKDYFKSLLNTVSKLYEEKTIFF